MLDRIVDMAKNSGFLRLLVVITIVAELLTLAVNFINGYLWWGENTWKLYVVGVVDAFLVSVIALPVIIFIILRLKQAEQETAAKSAYLDNILRSATDMAIAATDADFRITLFNPAAEKMFGLTSGQVIGRDVRSLHEGRGIGEDKFSAALAQFMRKGEYRFSIAREGEDGMRNLDLRVSGITNEAGTLTGYVLTARDVTERNNYEKAIRESEERFRSLVESTSDWVWEVDQNARYTYASPRIREILGYEPEEVLGRTPFDLMPDEEAARVAGEFAGIAEKAQPFTALVNVNLHKDGRRIVLETSGVPIMGNDGTLLGYRGIDRDITERMRAHEALRESETKFRTLVEHSLVGVAIIQDGRYVYINPRHAQMLGYTQEEMIGLPSVLDIVHPEDRDTVAENIRKRTTGEVRDIRYNFRFLRKDGSVAHVEVHGSTAEYGGRPAVIGSVLDITERRKAEDEIRKLNEDLELRVAERTAELAESEHRYRMLMEQASDGIGIMEPGGRITTVNTRLCELLGYTEEEVLSLSLGDVFTPDEMPLVMADLELIGSGETVVRDRTVRRKDGATLSVEISAKMLEDGSIQAIGRDITQRKEAERALRKSEERLRHVVQHMPVMMSAFAEDGSIIVWNRECERVTGYLADELVGRPDALRILCPDDAYREAVLLKWSEMGNNYRDWEWDITCKDGSVRTVAWSNKSDIISIPGWASWGIGIDVTVRRKAQDELRESEHSYRTLAENLPGIVYRVTTDGCDEMQFFNDMLMPLTGYGPEELRFGKCCSIDSLIAPEDRVTVVAEVKKAVAENRPFLVEYRLMHKDGSIRHMQERGRPVRGDDGRPLYIDGVILDITELKNAQEQKDAMQARLNESQKMEAIGNLAGGVSHDFSSLLTVIQGDSEILKDLLGEGHPAEEYLQQIDRAASMASDLTRKLLIFSRRKPMARVLMDVNEAVDGTVGLIKRLMGENVLVETGLGVDVWKVEADAAALEQTLMNLMINARDAMPEGGRIQVSTANIELDEERCKRLENSRPGRFVRISVSDTGVGMDDETKKRIFEPFFTTKPKGRGIGLGLSVVYGIIKEHGGWIDVVSSPGEGTRFDLYFEAYESVPR